ncbi:unnamed protein product [Parnassius mnemosyne]|uniref:Chromatin target of PRMT1 protein C-terminal domain-containing protein n=1 Tax=Parnassius mnemosyne TaxID=213953 RepID=A0AAV1LH49_9NEOP
MVIEKVHGLQATGISLNDRFTMLASAAPDRVTRARTPRRRTNIGSFGSIGFFNQGFDINNRNLIEQIARKLQLQARRQALKQRLGIAGPLRRYGSESSLPGLRRSNSFGNLNQRQNIKNRVAWRQSNNNLSRSASFGNLSQGTWRGRGFRRRGGRVGALRGRVGTLRGRLRGSRMQFGRTFGRPANRMQTRTQNLRRRMRGRGRGRGGVVRNQTNQKPVPTKEELDAQLDQYMASTKTALDKELDAYMKSAMELE